MVELIRTNDPVLISWLENALGSLGVGFAVLDQHMSVLEGSAAAIPRRILVAEADIGRARMVLAEAEAIARSGADGG